MDELKDTISVIVPVYNVEPFLEKCIVSILQQSYHRLEVILVDDGSTDNSGAICDRFAATDARVRVVHGANGGVSHARNVGLELATGQYIGFVDSDDYIEPDMYEALLLALKRTGADIASTGIIRENGNKKTVIRCPSEETVYSDEETLREILHSRNVGSSVWSKLYKSECWQTVRFPVGETNEDVKVLFELHQGRSLVHTAKALYHYVAQNGSITATIGDHKVAIAMRNADAFFTRVKDYPALTGDILYYKTTCARGGVIVLGNSCTALARECRQFYNAHWKILGFNVKNLLLRVNLYHFLRRIYHGIKRKA